MWANPQVEKIAKNRLEICGECPKRSNYPGPVNMKSQCTLCGCWIEAKTRSINSTCPIDKWGGEKIEDEGKKI